MLNEQTYASVREKIADALAELDAELTTAEGRAKVAVEEAITGLEQAAKGLILHQTGPYATEKPRDAVSEPTDAPESAKVVYVLTSPTYVPEGGPIVGVFASEADAQAYETAATPPVSDGTIVPFAVTSAGSLTAPVEAPEPAGEADTTENAAPAEETTEPAGDATETEAPVDNGNAANAVDLSTMTSLQLDEYAAAQGIELPADADTEGKVAAIAAVLDAEKQVA